MNTAFQRTTRRVKKAFLSDQCREIKENNRSQSGPPLPHAHSTFWVGGRGGGGGEAFWGATGGKRAEVRI